MKKEYYYWLNTIFLAVVLVLLIFPRIYPYTKYYSMKIPFADPDTCYHARRIIYVATHNMQLPFYDPLVAHPYGAIPMLSPFYDWISALPSYLISFGNPGEALIIRTSMFLTLIFGLSALAILGLLVYKATGNLTASLLTVFLVGFTTPQLKITSIENMDQDSLLLLLFSLILLQSYRMFSADKPLHFIKDIFYISLLISLLFWVWPGSYLYMGTIALFHFLYPLIRKKIQLLKSFAQSYAIAGVLIAPLAFIHYHFGKELLRFEYVSLFTLLFFFSFASFFYIIYTIMQWKSSNNKRVLLIKFLVLSFILIIMALFSFKPLTEGIKFAQAQNIWLSTIQESKPLFYLERGALKEFTLDRVIGNFGYLFFLFPIAYIVLLIWHRQMSAEIIIMFLTSGAVFGFLAFSQRRYTVEFSVPYGVIISYFIVWLYQKILKGFRVVALIIFTIIIAVSLMPLKKYFKESYSPLNALYDGFAWLKNDAGLKNTEINTGHIQKTGAIAPWDFGHHLHFYSEMPTIADNLGTNVEPTTGFYDMARFFLADNEDDAIRILKKYKCSYVVVPRSAWAFDQYAVLIGLDPASYFKYTVAKNNENYITLIPQPALLKTMGLRFADTYGSANPTNNIQNIYLTALKHFRLIYESPAGISAGQPVPAGSLKIYQYVEGSILKVDVPGNPPYELEGLVKTNIGRYFYYRQRGYLSDKIIAPYPTHRIKDYPYAEYYQLFINDRTYEFNDIE